MDRDTHSLERSPVEQPPVRSMEAPRQEERSTLSRERQALTGRTYAYHVSPAELETMLHIGRFRTIAVDDLATYRYHSDVDEMREDLGSLAAQGLIQRRTAWTDSKTEKLEVVVLTARGKELLEREANPGGGQRLYAGFVKPSEVAHDAAIYRMYQAEKNRIEQAGGRVRRVVLDYEFKQKIYSPLGKAQNVPPREYARRQAEIARQNDLKVVRGKIPLPDLRIEYETGNGERAHVDLELATHHYRGGQLRDKAQAGFKIYAPQDSVSRLTAAFDPEFAAQIFSL
jgi:hypothetical protein